MNAPLKSLDTQFAFAPQTPIYDRLNRLLVALESRFRSVEATKADYDAAVDKLTTLGLARINETLGPATQKILDLTSLGFLICESESSMLLETGVDKSIIVTAGTSRDLFAPTAFVAVQRKSNFTDWGYAEVQSYNAVNGALALRFLAIYGDPGPHDDWQISDAPGVSEATYYWYLQTVAARDAAVVARAAAEVAQAAAEDAAAVAEAAAGADLSILVRRDGSTAFTAPQSGAAPAEGADNAQFPTTSWVWDRLDAFDANYPLLTGLRDFTGVQRGVTPAASANGIEFSTTFWVLNRITERLGGYVLRNGGTPFTAMQGGVAPSNPADNTANLITSAWANTRITTVVTAGGWNFTNINTGPSPGDGVANFQIPNTAWVQQAITARFNAFVGAAPAALDTVYELAAQMQSDESAAAALTTSVGNRLRVDLVPGYSAAQKQNARTNIGLFNRAQCYLRVVGSTIVLEPDGGNLIPIQGVMRAMSTNLNADGLTLGSDITHAVYVQDNGAGALAFFFDPFAPAPTPDGNGVLVMAGAAQRTFVGVARHISASNQVVVASWYNKRPKTYQFAASGGPLSGAQQYFNAAFAPVLYWPNESLHVTVIGQAVQTADGTYGFIGAWTGFRFLGLGSYIFASPLAQAFNVGGWDTPVLYEGGNYYMAVGFAGNPNMDGSGWGSLISNNATGQVTVWA